MFYDRFDHNIVSVAFGIAAHQQPVTGLGVISGPKIISGSTDSTVKVLKFGILTMVVGWFQLTYFI